MFKGRNCTPLATEIPVDRVYTPPTVDELPKPPVEKKELKNPDDYFVLQELERRGKEVVELKEDSFKRKIKLSYMKSRFPTEYKLMKSYLSN